MLKQLTKFTLSIFFNVFKKIVQRNNCLYFFLLSIKINPKIAHITNAIGSPSGATVTCTNKTPTITGKTINAPNARYVGIIIKIPPINSAIATHGINQEISKNASLSLTNATGKPSGTGM